MRSSRPLVLDTGALIALERKRQRMVEMIKSARTSGGVLLVASVCVAEWWRGRTDVRETILATVRVEQTDDALMKVTGEALAAVPSASTIDAIVMALAARHGAVVFTSDVDDLTRLQLAFPSVRVLGV